jgi:hypothetical protein
MMKAGRNRSTNTNLGLVHMIIIPFVRSPNGHHHEILLSIQTKVVYRGLEKVRISFKPFGEIDWGEEAHVRVVQCVGEAERLACERTEGLPVLSARSTLLSYLISYTILETKT